MSHDVAMCLFGPWCLWREQSPVVVLLCFSVLTRLMLSSTAHFRKQPEMSTAFWYSGFFFLSCVKLACHSLIVLHVSHNDLQTPICHSSDCSIGRTQGPFPGDCEVGNGPMSKVVASYAAGQKVS